jgi:hypothetical protein
VANNIESLPEVNLAHSTNGEGVLVRGESVEKCESFGRGALALSFFSSTTAVRQEGFVG